jgi:hypothetical protein
VLAKPGGRVALLRRQGCCCCCCCCCGGGGGGGGPIPPLCGRPLLGAGQRAKQKGQLLGVLAQQLQPVAAGARCCARAARSARRLCRVGCLQPAKGLHVKVALQGAHGHACSDGQQPHGPAAALPHQHAPRLPRALRALNHLCQKVLAKGAPHHLALRLKNGRQVVKVLHARRAHQQRGAGAGQQVQGARAARSSQRRAHAAQRRQRRRSGPAQRVLCQPRRGGRRHQQVLHLWQGLQGVQQQAARQGGGGRRAARAAALCALCNGCAAQQRSVAGREERALHQLLHLCNGSGGVQARERGGNAH